jgi:hypothetical protein
MEYRYSPAASSTTGTSSLAIAKDLNAAPVPFVIKGSMEFEQNSGQLIALNHFAPTDPGFST